MEPLATAAASILHQLDDQCRTWSNYHASSCTLLASLLNITRQQEYTQKQLTDHSSHPSSLHNKNALPFGPQTLELLIHKQSLEVESVIQQLLSFLKTMQQIVDQMTSLEQQAEALVRRWQTKKDEPLEKSSSAQSEKDALCATAMITPLQALEWTHQVRDMYHAEYQVKRAQLSQDSLSQALGRYESLEQLYRNWNLQRRIDFGLEQEIKERLDTFKRIHDYAILTK
ncbi:hypothetical protein BGW41_003184 [Actinomortierella wolfii]|nr:hypothetical protein BGW41_003184 [Actinomortierella wolfii]